MYFAPGAALPGIGYRGVVEKYKGKFAHGWDKQRKITFERQKELGVIPQDAVLTPRHDEIPSWDDMDPALKPVLEREMEVYAAFMEHTDHHVGRLLDALGTRDGQHAGLRDHRRQGRVGGGHGAGRIQRDGQLQRHGQDRDAPIYDVEAGRVRR